MVQCWERSPPTDVVPVLFRPGAICGLSLLLVLALLRVLQFSSLRKNHQFQFDQDRGPAWKPAKADVASSLNIAIYLFYLFTMTQKTVFNISKLPEESWKHMK